MRRLIDILFALFWIILLAPILLFIAVLIRIDSPGSVLYLPQMVGMSGRVFTLWRFRTMSVGITDSDPGPRLTGIGRFLRNYSLDHLPMLINLLKGDLTIVGPRPMEIDAVDPEDPTWKRYFEVKPGIVNYAVLKLGKLWTPSRSIDPVLNQELELDYLQKRSARFDFDVFLKSMRALVISKWNIKARGEPDREVKDKVGRGLP